MPYDHVTSLLNDLDWLCVPERITYTSCAFWCTTVFMARRRGIYKMSFSLLLK